MLYSKKKQTKTNIRHNVVQSENVAKVQQLDLCASKTYLYKGYLFIEQVSIFFLIISEFQIETPSYTKGG